jgi:hypothetical protein
MPASGLGPTLGLVEVVLMLSGRPLRVEWPTKVATHCENSVALDAYGCVCYVSLYARVPRHSPVSGQGGGVAAAAVGN